MTISILPESAPFNPEQRAWLNGFFAGMLGLQGTDGARLAAVQQVALGMGAVAEAGTAPIVEPEEDFPWHDPALPIDDRMALAADKPLPRKLMAAMAQLNCGACGYLCKTYSEAIANGSEANLKLCSPGGGDTAKMIKMLLKEQPAANGKAKAGGSNGKATSSWSRANPFPAKLVASTNLNQAGSDKHTSHVVLDLSGSGLTYEPGDAVGVYPRNCPEFVAQIITALGQSESESLNEILLSANLREVDERQIAVLLEHATEAEQYQLRKLAEDDDQLAGMDLLDLLELCPGIRVDAEQLAASLTPIAPRLYSIASSQRAQPNEVHLTIGKATRLVGNRLRKGVASTMFSDRSAPGESVRVFIQPSHGFKLPADDNAPIIMVGPGTGIAPFRSFLQERHARGAKGSSWLLFGDQRSATDFLYRDEWQTYLDAGVLSRLDTAFSRDQAEKIYVQTRMVEHGAELFAWLQRGAYFYVCGDAKRMAADVDRALHQVVRDCGQMSESAAAEYVGKLRKDQRYLRDVY